MVTGKTLKIVSPTPQETERIGSLVGKMLKRGYVIALSGELGTGKTTLVRGIAHGTGCDMRDVASPSFTLINEYNGPFPLFHIDLYRLNGKGELYEIGYEEYIRGDGAVVIEWADRMPQAIPEESLWIALRYLDSERREIVMQARGETYEEMIEELREKFYTWTFRPLSN